MRGNIVQCLGMFQVFLEVFDFYYFASATRFHFAVRLLSNRSQMSTKCGKNEKSGTRAAGECACVSLMMA